MTIRTSCRAELQSLAAPNRGCQGQRPSTSNSKLQLRNVLIKTRSPRITTFSSVNSSVTVLIMSAAIRRSSPTSKPPSYVTLERLERRSSIGTKTNTQSAQHRHHHRNRDHNDREYLDPFRDHTGYLEFSNRQSIHLVKPCSNIRS